MADNNRAAARSPLPVMAGVALVVIAGWLAWLGPQAAVDAIRANWPVSLTMVLGSFVAGASSEGGGAVAFPVFTKALHVAPADARLFALLIQSVGMTAASVTIFAMRVRVDVRSLLLASVGGAAGVAIGLLAIAPLAPPAEVRMLFTAMQFGFAIVLILSLKRGGGKAARARIDAPARALEIVGAGVVGGLVSGLVGSGLDLVLFALLNLRHNVSEKVATPTSVVVMAINSLVAVGVYRSAVGSPPENVVQMWAAAIPIVVVGAPMGAWFCAWLRRATIGWMLVGLIAVEVATTLWLVPLTPTVAATGLGVSTLCGAVCFLMARPRNS